MTDIIPAPQVSHRLKIVLFVLVLGALVIVSRFIPLGDIALELLEDVREMGFPGYLLFLAIFTAGTVIFMPGPLMALAAGAAFGPVAGFFVASFGRTLGACCSFVIARFGIRDVVARRVEKSRHMLAIDRAARRQGFYVVLLTRLVPVIPFSVINYLYGVSRVRFRHFASATWVGLIPGTVFGVLVGDAAEEIATAGFREYADEWPVALKLGLLLVFIVVVFTLARVARKALKEEIGEDIPPITKDS